MLCVEKSAAHSVLLRFLRTHPFSPAGTFSREWEKTQRRFPAEAFSGERQTRSRFFLSPWTPSFFHAESPGWLDRSLGTEASGGWVVSVYGYCAASRRKNTAGKPLSARSRLIRPQILADRPLGRCPAVHSPPAARSAHSASPGIRSGVVVPGGDLRRPADLALLFRGVPGLS